MASDGAVCHYVRLRWLVEQDIRTESRVTTNYALLLSVTTEPSSLWLAFDYRCCDDEENDHLRELGDNYNDSEHWAWFHGRRYLLDYAPPSFEDDTVSHKARSSGAHGKGYLGVQKPFDLAMISRDIKKDWKDRVSSGLDSEMARACIDESSVVLGDTLRAVPSKPIGWAEK